MDTLLNALLKILEYFYDPKKSRGDPKTNVCRNIVKLHLLVVDFSLILKQLRETLKNELAPVLIIHEEEEDEVASTFAALFSRDNNFSSVQTSTLISHIDHYDYQHQDMVLRIADAYNSLNQTRNEIFNLVVKAIPIRKLGILFPELEKGVISMIVMDVPHVLKGGEPRTQLITSSLMRKDAKRLNAMKFGFQLAFINALNADSDTAWKEYLGELDETNTKLNEMRETLAAFVRENCSLSDIL